MATEFMGSRSPKLEALAREIAERSLEEEERKKKKKRKKRTSVTTFYKGEVYNP